MLPLIRGIDWVKTYVHDGVTYAPARIQVSSHNVILLGDWVVLNPFSPFVSYNDPANPPNQVGTVVAVENGIAEVRWLRNKISNFYPVASYDLIRLEVINKPGVSLPDSYVIQ